MIKQNWGFTCFLMGVIALIPLLGYAKPPLDLKELTQLGIQNNKDLKAARFAIAIAEARLTQSGLWSNPSLNLNNNDDRLFNNEGEYSRSINFNQAFPISGRIGRQKTVARIDILRAQAEVFEATRQLSAKVANAFYTVVVAENRMQQLNYLQGINQELVRVIHNRYHAAEISKLDDNSARIEYARIKQEKQLLKSQLISQYALLNQLIGRAPNASLHVEKTIRIAKGLPSLGSLINHALNNRPDRRGLLLAEQRALADRRLAQAERFADWNLGVGVQQDKIVVEGAPPQQADRTLGVSLSIPLPILNRNQGRILEAGATGAQAMMAIDALNLAIETEVTSNYGQLNALKISVVQTQGTSLRLGLENVTLAREAYQNGQVSFLNVLQVQRQQNEVQMAYLTTVGQYFQSYVALCTAIGAPHSSELCSYLSFTKDTTK
ncbi:TPA: TolC family protein [Legionella pneumophila subsp. pneumophila]|jgi:cobalt-zinc-cadmium efflux system outer membrane protein|uniref:TolC family protein n=1 Tax=Legionella TaxID=445 RepID=UPI0007708445|nr:TolC family protein [Legionella sp. PC1000]CZP44844.1 Cation efflux system protein CzcC [Legionella pneumophila]HAT9067712.1 TolC family protein [Legionella pneumophila subsp. pneumophila]QLZ70902.1 TolC family protein [Legionella sp. PC1000]QLZ70993.1 TolC family protein [Legionella sp. PC1000]